jgi:hypothetical protein
LVLAVVAVLHQQTETTLFLARLLLLLVAKVETTEAVETVVVQVAVTRVREQPHRDLMVVRQEFTVAAVAVLAATV